LEQFAINSAGQQFVSESVQGALGYKDVSLRSWTITPHHPALLERFVIVAPSMNVQTYLLGGTAAAVPPPLRPSDPALCGSCPLVTPY